MSDVLHRLEQRAVAILLVAAAVAFGIGRALQAIDRATTLGARRG